MSFRIRRIHDDVLPANQLALAQVQTLLREQFPLAPAREFATLPRKLKNPVHYRFRAMLVVAERSSRLLGAAFLLHEADLRFVYLDYMAAGSGRTGGGIGGALYQRVREEARALDVVGIFMECLPDDPALSPDPAIRAQNRARLRFYERFGTRPITNTDYETPLSAQDTDPPYLVFDPLGSKRLPRREHAQHIVRTILERKYAKLCPPAYVDRVVASITDDPVRLRAPRYQKSPPAAAVTGSLPEDEKVLLVVNDRHDIHHVRERGYVESPARLRSILKSLDPTGLFRRVDPSTFGEQHLLAVHAPDYLSYFKRVCAQLPEPQNAVYPYVFPVRNRARPPVELAVRAGYYCLDTFTPLTRNAYLAARRAVDCALTAAREVAQGHARLAYAALRPPGHHAERRYFGGFCYFNNAAAAAHFMSRTGRVAVLDVDYHHGNGSQYIFYERADVLTLSIHGHPRFAYPYFSGFEDERGEGSGKGFNRNYPLGEHLDGAGYRKVLERALVRVRRFQPTFLVLALGLDTAKADPTGTWSLLPDDFEENGRLIGELGLPTLVVQEGGYDTRVLGRNARRFFLGLWQGLFGRSPKPRRAARAT